MSSINSDIKSFMFFSKHKALVMKNVLFVSKTAEDYFSKKYSNLVIDSAEINKNTYNQLVTNYISKEQLDVFNV